MLVLLNSATVTTMTNNRYDFDHMTRTVFEPARSDDLKLVDAEYDKYWMMTVLQYWMMMLRDKKQLIN